MSINMTPGVWVTDRRYHVNILGRLTIGTVGQWIGELAYYGGLVRYEDGGRHSRFGGQLEDYGDLLERISDLPALATGESLATRQQIHDAVCSAMQWYVRPSTADATIKVTGRITFEANASVSNRNTNSFDLLGHAKSKIVENVIECLSLKQRLKFVREFEEKMKPLPMEPLP